jgi:hypothetical protein
MRRVTSTPEIRQVHVSSLSRNFPMQISEIGNLKTHHEHDDEEEGVHGVVDECEDSNKVNPFCGVENSSTEQTVVEDPDDFGFFNIDDEDEDYNNDSAQFQEGSVFEQAEKNRLKELREQEQIALLEDKNSEALATAVRRRSSGNNNGKKSSLRRGSAYGKKEEGIPLDFERKEYNRVLPKPDILSQAIGGGGTGTGGGMKKSTSRGLFRVSSEPVFVRPVYLEDEEEKEEEQHVAATIANIADENETGRWSVNSSSISSTFVEGAMKRRISFGTIKIREHSQTMGDNPSCTYGTPVQLDWDYEELEDIKVEDYEKFRPSTRSKKEFHLNHFQRRNLLKLNGFSSVDISKTKKQVSKMRSQRERTKFLVLNYPALNAVEDAFESGARKVKRVVLKAAKNKCSGVGTENNSSVIDTSTGRTIELRNNDVSIQSSPI